MYAQKLLIIYVTSIQRSLQHYVTKVSQKVKPAGSERFIQATV